MPVVFLYLCVRIAGFYLSVLMYWGEWQVGPVFMCMPTETWKICMLSCV